MEVEPERKRHAQIVYLETFVSRLEQELGSGSWREVAAGGSVPVVPGRLLRLQALLLARSALKSGGDLAMIIAACNSMDLKGTLAVREAGRVARERRERIALSAAAGTSARSTTRTNESRSLTSLARLARSCPRNNTHTIDPNQFPHRTRRRSPDPQRSKVSLDYSKSVPSDAKRDVFATLQYEPPHPATRPLTRLDE